MRGQFIYPPKTLWKIAYYEHVPVLFEIGCDKALFDNLKISEETELCCEYMGKLPVISISLKGMNADSFLTELLNKHYGQRAIVLIDEYDVPLAKAGERGYYDEMAALIRILFENVLKTNGNLYFEVLTGCLRVATVRGKHASGRYPYRSEIWHCLQPKELQGSAGKGIICVYYSKSPVVCRERQIIFLICLSRHNTAVKLVFLLRIFLSYMYASAILYCS